MKKALVISGIFFIIILLEKWLINPPIESWTNAHKDWHDVKVMFISMILDSIALIVPLFLLLILFCKK